MKLKLKSQIVGDKKKILPYKIFSNIELFIISPVELAENGFFRLLLCKFVYKSWKMIETLAGPVERTVIGYSDRSLTVLWPRIIMANNDKKKHLKHCNYDSAIKFKLAGVGINTIILSFRDKN